SLLQRSNPLGAKSMPLQPHCIQPIATCLARRHNFRKWRHILRNHRIRSNVSMPPNAAKLMHRAKSPNRRVILHSHMPRQSSPIYKTRMTANLIVMPNVRIIHDQIVATHPRNAAALGSPAIHSTEFAKIILVANLKRYDLSAKSQILRIAANHRKWINAIPASQPRRPLHHSVMLQNAAVAQFHVIANNRISANLHTRSEEHTSELQS